MREILQWSFFLVRGLQGERSILLSKFFGIASSKQDLYKWHSWNPFAIPYVVFLSGCINTSGILGILLP